MMKSLINPSLHEKRDSQSLAKYSWEIVNITASVYPYSQFLPKGEWQIGGSCVTAWAEIPVSTRTLGALYASFSIEGPL